MDQPCSYEDLRSCLHSIARINSITLAHRPTLLWLEEMRTTMLTLNRPIHIVDVGCGYGDLLRRIQGWAVRRHVPVILTGIDLNPDAVRAARASTPAGVATFRLGNAFDYAPETGIDVVVNSLLTHHLEDAQIVTFLAWMERTVKLGWFINDLHRQPLPYRLFHMLIRFTNVHRFAKHDGGVSILRGFRKEDWIALLAAASIPRTGYRVLPFRPARLCVARVR